MRFVKDRVFAGVAAVVLVGGLSSTALLTDPLKQLRSRLLDGSALLTDEVNGRVVSVNGSSGRPDLAIRLPGDEGRSLSIVQRDGAAYVVADGGTKDERVLYRVDDPSARLPATNILGSDRVLTGGGKLFTIGAKEDEMVVLRRDPVTLEPIGEALQFSLDSFAVVDHAGELVVYEPKLGMLSIVDDGGVSAPLNVGKPGEKVELGVTADRVVVVRPQSGVVAIIRDGRIESELSLPVTGGRARLAESVDGDFTAVLMETLDGPELVSFDVMSGDVASTSIDIDFDSLGSPMVARDGIYLARPTAGQVLRVAPDGKVFPIDVGVGRGESFFEAFVDDGFVYVNNPGGPMAAVVDGSGPRMVEKYSEDIPEVDPNSAEQPESKPEVPEVPQVPEVPEVPQTTAKPATVPPPSTSGPPQISTPSSNASPSTTGAPPSAPAVAPVSTTAPTGGDGATSSTPTTSSKPTTPSTPTTTSTTQTTDVPPPVATAPSAVQNLVAAGRNESLVLSWDPPSDDGGSSITRYDVVCSPSCGQLTSNTGSLTIRQLTNGTEYTVTVVAVNDAGTGPGTAITGTPTLRKAPSPSGVTVTASEDGSGAVTVSWASAADAAFVVDQYSVSCVSSSGGIAVSMSVAPDQSSIAFGGDVGWTFDVDDSPDYTCAVTAEGAYIDESSVRVASDGITGSPVDPWRVTDSNVTLAMGTADRQAWWTFGQPTIEGRPFDLGCVVADSSSQAVVFSGAATPDGAAGQFRCAASSLVNGRGYSPTLTANVGGLEIDLTEGGNLTAYPSGRPNVSVSIGVSKVSLTSNFSIDANGLSGLSCEYGLEQLGLGGLPNTSGSCGSDVRSSLRAGTAYRVWFAISGFDGNGNSHRYDGYYWDTATQQAIATVDVVAHYSGLSAPGACGQADGTTFQTNPSYVSGGNGICAAQGSNWNVECWTEGTGHDPTGADGSSDHRWGAVPGYGWLNFNYLAGDPGAGHC